MSQHLGNRGGFGRAGHFHPPEGPVRFAWPSPSVKPKRLDLGFEIVGNTPEQFTAFQLAEYNRWKNVIEVGKITAD